MASFIILFVLGNIIGGVLYKFIPKLNENLRLQNDYEIIQNVTGNPEDIFSLELLLKNYLIKNNLKYIPSKKFGGSVRECFKF